MEIWVAEYSPSQKAFHIELLNMAVRTNLEVILDNHRNDKQVAPDFLIFACGTREHCQSSCDNLEKVVRGKG